LGIIIIVVLSEIPVVSGTIYSQRRFFVLRLFLPFSIAVGFITQSASIVAIRPDCPITMITMKRAEGIPDRLLFIL
jgi:hypothetical protein